jgi:cell division protein FtsN
MCPFLDEEDDYLIGEGRDFTKPTRSLSSFFSETDRKFFVIGGVAAAVVLIVVVYVIYFNSKPIDLDELPVIQADPAPFKVKPETNEVVKHQDKIVYDNISGDNHSVVEKLAPQSEEILSIQEIEAGDAISEEEKSNIIKAFDDLAPDKEYQINYVKKNSKRATTNSAGVVVVENDERPPINRIEENGTSKSLSDGKLKIRDIAAQIASKPTGTFMVQVGTVPTKAAAEAEYNRVIRKNKALKNFGKKIFKVDLGKKKGVKYRIQIGPFSTKEEANKVVATMKKNRFSAYVTR